MEASHSLCITIRRWGYPVSKVCTALVMVPLLLLAVSSASAQHAQATAKPSTVAHASLTCRDCHTGVTRDREIVGPPVRKCQECHSAGSAMTHGVTPPAVDLLHKENATSPTCVGCHGYHNILKPDAKSSPLSRGHVVEMCGSCHLNPQLKHGIPQASGYAKSLHGRSAHGGNAAAAVCTDCHGIHPKKNGGRDSLSVLRPNVPATCGQCHQEAHAVYSGSAHGKAVKDGRPYAAVCTDCHTEHNIVSPSDPSSPVSGANVVNTCAKCHGDSTYVRLHDLPPMRVSSYQRSYHGIANKYGDVKIANCVSCHGAHDILPASDPESKINPSNLSFTCAECHEDAGSWKQLGQIHVATTGIQAKVLTIVGFLYRLFVYGMIAAFLGYILLDLFARWLAHRRGITKRMHALIASLPEPDEQWLLRMDRVERFQHFTLLFSFLLLVLSGFALLFPNAAVSEWITAASGGMAGRAIVHRVGAVLLMALGPFHAWWFLRQPRGRTFILAMLPKWSDVTQCWQTVKYLLRFSPQPARFGRYSFIEKFEYWAVIWGMAIMGFTGVVMTFTDWFLRYLPKWVWDSCKLVHGWEAMLALVAIVVWHHYHVMWRPGPANRSWLTGYLTFEQFVEEHPLEYERAVTEEGARATGRRK